MGKYSCEACKKKCKKEAIRLQDKYFHVGCFMCKACNKQLVTDGYFKRGEDHYCKEDYQRLFGTKCFACGKIVEGEVTTVLDKQYHKSCFCCTKCKRKFEPGEKATFVNNNKEHWCQKCVHQDELETKARNTENRSPIEALKVDERVPSPKPSSPLQTTSPDLGNVAASPVLPISPSGGYGTSGDESFRSNSIEHSTSLTSSNDQSKINDSNSKPDVKRTSSVPKVFGMPDNKFYNISYLERAGNDFKRGPASLPITTKEQPSGHFHRPDNFSYNNQRTDLKIETKKNGERTNGQKQPSQQKRYYEGGLVPIERDDWPGPPEPAAAYPELLREKLPQKPSENVDENDVEMTNQSTMLNKEIGELEKIQDSGAAQVILRDLKKKRSVSPTLDPRNASRVPSAETACQHKLRYETPYFASPSRYLDKKPSHSCENGRPSTSLGLLRHDGRPGSRVRPGTAQETDGYLSDYLEEFHRRPLSSNGILKSDTFDSSRSFEDGVDPNTGLKHFSRLKSTTLPVGLTAPNYFDSLRIASDRKSVEPVKIFTLEELKDENILQMPGINRSALETHLSKEEFESVFQMTQLEFSRTPAWRRNEIRARLGLK